MKVSIQTFLEPRAMARPPESKEGGNRGVSSKKKSRKIRNV